MSKATPLERLMLGLINEERVKAGLDPLRLERRLNDASEDHSAWMIDQDLFSHDGAGDSDAGERMRDAGFPFEGNWAWGENIALQSERGATGLSDDVADLHRGLMDSPGHRANILDARFEVVGIGIERGEYKGFDALVATQNFAVSSASMRFDGPASPSKPDPKPAPNEAPVLHVEDFVLKPGQFHRIAKHVDYSDAEGHRAARFEIEDPSGEARVLVSGRTVDAGDGHVLEAGDLATLTIRFDPSGEDQTFRMRAHDGHRWGGWDSFTIRSDAGASLRSVASEPASDGPALSVEADDVVLAAGERVRLADILRVTTDGDPVRSFQIRDPDGGAGLWSARGGSIDASDGRWFGAGAIGRLHVEAGDHPSERELMIRAGDGDDRSAWEAFTVTTTGWDDLA